MTLNLACVGAHSSSVGGRSPDVLKALEILSLESGIEPRGAIFTRSEVVDFILDLVGYTEDQPLFEKRVLEPSFGMGDFLLPIIRRLLASWEAAYKNGTIVDGLSDAIRAVELHRDSYVMTRTAVLELLGQKGVEHRSAEALVDRWLCQDDFLLTSIDGQFDFSVGNPPYVRQELIPTSLIDAYRQQYSTIYDRADLYVPFIERSLSLLNQKGCLGFICADRWMKNKYGGPLRKFVADNFHLKIYVDMFNTSAFHSDVDAYPAITVISRERSGATRIVHQPKIEADSLTKLSEALLNPEYPENLESISEVTRVTNGAEPWLLGSQDQVRLVRRLESEFPSLEQAGCHVGIGVATGADKAFIGDYERLDVELDRKLPLVTTRDIKAGVVQWHGLGVINPFSNDGGLVELDEYPRLRLYLENNKERIVKRRCARDRPNKWYRTIDRINPELMAKPKLLIPDIKGQANVVYEPGNLYPHHNLYYITSDMWDLHALQAVMLSEVARLFIATYSTKMRGGFLRYQAQYLRRIRIPRWSEVPESLRAELAACAVRRDLSACNQAVYRLYGLDPDEQASIGGDGRGNGA